MRLYVHCEMRAGRLRACPLFLVSLYCNSGQVYYFSPFKGTDSSGSSGSSAGISGFPFRIYPGKGHYLGWMALDPIQAVYQPISWESVSMNLDPGKSFEARYVLLVDVEAKNILENIYRTLGVRTAKVKIDTAERIGGHGKNRGSG